MEWYPKKYIHPWLLRFADRKSFQYLRDINFVEREFSANDPVKCRKRDIIYSVNRPWTSRFLLNNIEFSARSCLFKLGRGQIEHPRAKTFLRGDIVI